MKLFFLSEAEKINETVKLYFNQYLRGQTLTLEQRESEQLAFRRTDFRRSTCPPKMAMIPGKTLTITPSYNYNYSTEKRGKPKLCFKKKLYKCSIISYLVSFSSWRKLKKKKNIYIYIYVYTHTHTHTHTHT
jgi:hypothetical protein